MEEHPSIIFSTCRDKRSLEHLRLRLNQLGIPTAEFHEPYEGWGLTAISCCLDEGQRHLLKGLPLWRLPTQEQS